VADLELTTGTRFIERNIPFNAIHPLGDGGNSGHGSIPYQQCP
jgi:hypothetical protein